MIFSFFLSILVLGRTRISEDSSEIVFLLVENYTMTAPYGLRIVWEFLARNTSVLNW